MIDETGTKLTARNLRLEDYQALREIALKAYKGVAEPWSEEHLKRLLSLFPEGQICIEDNGRPVAVALSLIIDFSLFGDQHSYYEIIKNGTFKSHDPDGDYLYGIDVSVDPDYQGMRLGRRLYDLRRELAVSLNLKGIMIGGRIPGYAKYAREMDAQQYIIKVKNREIYDPVMTFQLSNDFHVRNLLDDYWPGDHHSRGNAVLLEWINIYYRKKTKLIGKTKSIARLGVVQWKMRRFESFADFLQQAEFFIDTVSDYKADIVLFPELFNAPLIHAYEGNSPMQAMRMLAGYTEEMRQAMTDMALRYNINIVAGSVPEILDDDRLYNVSYLCRRDGTWDRQEKLHITPGEAASWGFVASNSKFSIPMSARSASSSVMTLNSQNWQGFKH